MTRIRRLVRLDSYGWSRAAANLALFFITSNGLESNVANPAARESSCDIKIPAATFESHLERARARAYMSTAVMEHEIITKYPGECFVDEL